MKKTAERQAFILQETSKQDELECFSSGRAFVLQKKSTIKSSQKGNSNDQNSPQY